VTVMLLAIIGVMTCVFYLLVLIQCLRDTKRAKGILYMAEKRSNKRLSRGHARAVGSRKYAVRGRHMAARTSLRAAAAERHFQVRGPGWSAMEQDVYESIAGSLTGRKEACASSGGNAAQSALVT